MVNGRFDLVLAHARRLAARLEDAEAPDRQLVDAFVRKRDEESFTALVHRHGPMVFGVCSRLLRDSADVEDAFQATFTVLACKAASIRVPESTGSWLHGVALRAARKCRLGEVRRKHRECQSARPEMVEADDSITWEELRTVLDDELGRMDGSYRAPLILCFLEGRTQDEAAHQLGCSKSTLRRRLELARKKLQRQLAQRGVTLSAGLAPAWLPIVTAPIPITPYLTCSTARGALEFSAGHVIQAGMRRSVCTLTESVLHSMALSKLTWISTLALATSVLVSSAGFLALRTTGAESAAQSKAGMAPPLVHGQAKPVAMDVENGLRSAPVQETPVTKHSVLSGRMVDETGAAVTDAAHQQPAPETSFWAILFTKTGTYPHEVSAAYGELTLTGPKMDTLKPLPKDVRQVAYDPVAKQLYGISNHEVYQLDLKQNVTTALKPPTELRKLSWTCGIAFDTKRERVVVVTLGGVGHMYAYTPKTGKWALITEMGNLDLAALTYDVKTDRLYGLFQPHDGRPTIGVYNAVGAMVSTFELPDTAFPTKLTLGPVGRPVQLIGVGGDLAVLIEDRVVTIDLKTEKVRSDVDFKIAKLIRQLGAADSKVPEAASADLLKYGDTARKQLQDVAGPGNDAEIRRRAQQILELLEKKRRMHVIGLYGPQRPFWLVESWGRNIDWTRFCEALLEQGKNDAPTPGKRLWELLPTEAQAVVEDREMINRINDFAQPRRNSAPPERETIAALRKLTQGLEGALRRSDFYQEKVFAAVKLDDEGMKLQKRYKELSMLELWVFNRQLLEASFPDAVKKNAFPLEGATVPVRVVASEKPIILVLCSYESVRWLIQADKGAKIDKVIVGGYHLQDVTGTDVPVIYRDYERPARAKEGNDYFYAYEKDNENYPMMVDALRKLADAEIATFQGSHRYTGGPPIIVGGKD